MSLLIDHSETSQWVSSANWQLPCLTKEWSFWSVFAQFCLKGPILCCCFQWPVIDNNAYYASYCTSDILCWSLHRAMKISLPKVLNRILVYFRVIFNSKDQLSCFFACQKKSLEFCQQVWRIPIESNIIECRSREIWRTLHGSRWKGLVFASTFQFLISEGKSILLCFIDNEHSWPLVTFNHSVEISQLLWKIYWW